MSSLYEYYKTRAREVDLETNPEEWKEIVKKVIVLEVEEGEDFTDADLEVFAEHALDVYQTTLEALRKGKITKDEIQYLADMYDTLKEKFDED